MPRLARWICNSGVLAGQDSLQCYAFGCGSFLPKHDVNGMTERGQVHTVAVQLKHGDHEFVGRRTSRKTPFEVFQIFDSLAEHVRTVMSLRAPVAGKNYGGVHCRNRAERADPFLPP